MRYKVVYTKFALRFFRIISLCCSLFLLSTEIWGIYKGALRSILTAEKIDYDLLFNLLFNGIVTIFFVLLIFWPQKFGLLAVIALIYSVSIIPFEPRNYMGILMFFLGTVLLFVRGFFKKHKKTKLIIFSIFLLSLFIAQVRFGFYNFINYLITDIGVLLVIGLITFFLYAYFTNTLVSEDKKLNIALFKNLNERDCRILKRIQTGEKYSTIAKEENITEGTLKNRLHFVFETLETGDKRGFLSLYEDWKLFYGPNIIS